MESVDLAFQEDDIEDAVSSCLFEDSDSSSSDEDFELARQFLGKNGIGQLYSEEYLDEVRNYTDDKFIKHFRMNRNTVINITEGYKTSDIYRNLAKRGEC
ncbi:hypothetical protein HHI36_014945 [Cryptolaemus montrouzieri]|uniref:Uncharacterized protein n=1 Tax=Cryptolaemus montrouzieri TaxID=559131 RepID=A0ABD2N494_9CUCU